MNCENCNLVIMFLFLRKGFVFEFYEGAFWGHFSTKHIPPKSCSTRWGGKIWCKTMQNSCSGMFFCEKGKSLIRLRTSDHAYVSQEYFSAPSLGLALRKCLSFIISVVLSICFVVEAMKYDISKGRSRKYYTLLDEMYWCCLS